MTINMKKYAALFLSLVLTLLAMASPLLAHQALAAEDGGDFYQPNPECGTYLGKRADGVYEFEITIPDDRENQPKPLLLGHYYSYVEIDDPTGAISTRAGYFYGRSPGTADISYWVYREGERAMLKAVVHITVVPEAEFDPSVNRGFALVQPETAPEPVVTPEPETIPEPVVTPEPETTPEPVVTPEPETTPEPIVTPEPETTPEPLVAPKSETQQPELQRPAVQETKQTSAGVGSDGAARSDRGRTLNRRSDGNYELLWIKGYKLVYEDGQTKDNRKLMLTTYNSDFSEISSRELNMELPEVGGAYFGKSYNFLVFGQDNWEEDDNKEVLRIVKYSKDWTRLGAASLRDAFTTDVIGQHGNFSFAEAGDMLYIHLGRTIYTWTDGQQHQTNMTFSIRQSDMAVTDGRYSVSNNSTGYVSHSLQEDIIVDQAGNIITLDNGDSSPWGALLFKYSTKAGGPSFTGKGTPAVIRSWAGARDDIKTGSVVCALAETSQGYLSAIVDSGKGASYNLQTDSCTAYLLFTPKDNFSAQATQTRTVATGTAAVKPTMMYLIPTSPEGGYVMWYTTDIKKTGYDRYTLYYAAYAADGSVGSSVKLENVPLPYQGPIYAGGLLVWANDTQDSDGLKFCTLDASGHTAVYAAGGELAGKGDTQQPSVSGSSSTGTSNSGSTGSSQYSSTASSPFRDVPASHWAYRSILEAYQDGVMQGTGVAADGSRTFSPSEELTMAQFMAILTRAFYPNDVESSTASGAWYAPNYDVATRHKLFSGTASNQGSYKLPREDMAQIMYNVMTDKGAVLPGAQELESVRGRIPDLASVSGSNRTAVSACYSLELLTGMDTQGRFAPKAMMTRAQTAAVYCRLKAAMAGTAGSAASPAPAERPQSDFSAAYMSSKYYRALLGVELTGDYRKDIIAVASSQLGYGEGNSVDQLDGALVGSGNCTEYGRYLGSNGSAWCSEFASWCARMAGVPSSILKNSFSANVSVFDAPYYSWSDTVYAGGSYTPRPGDLALFAWSGTSTTASNLSHTAIVYDVEVQGSTVRITTIDGNSGDRVRINHRTANMSSGRVDKGTLVYFIAPEYEG